MDTLALARWQFGIVTVYHFLFVPVTIGLSFLVAGFQTAWVGTGQERYLRLTRFFGELFLITFAMGVVTGIVQEFQFGMNWSDYSRFVGDIFGAPLAIEGLLAFFLESTFLGLWIFGWDRLPRKVHLSTIWIAAFGTVLSAYFILAANAFMQNPVGYRINPALGRAELVDIVAVLLNPVATNAFAHTVAAAIMTGGAFVAGVAFWRLARFPAADSDTYRVAARWGAATVLAGGALVAITGDLLAKVMTSAQPMKMAAAEALYATSQPASFSLFTVGTLDGTREVFSVRVPHVLSFMATGDPNGRVEGIDDLQADYERRFGPGSYRPVIPVTYWAFRLMIGSGVLAALAALWLLWRLRQPGLRPSRWTVGTAVALPLLPLASNSIGWIFTEMGRQPWIVFSLMPTAAGVSPGTPAWYVLLSMTTLTLLYGGLAVLEVGLLLRRIRAGLPDVAHEPAGASAGSPGDGPIAHAY